MERGQLRLPLLGNTCDLFIVESGQVPFLKYALTVDPDVGNAVDGNSIKDKLPCIGWVGTGRLTKWRHAKSYRSRPAV